MAMRAHPIRYDLQESACFALRHLCHNNDANKKRILSLVCVCGFVCVCLFVCVSDEYCRERKEERVGGAGGERKLSKFPCHFLNF